MSGSVTVWLRTCVSKPKTLAILASSTIATIAAAICLPAGSLLSASQFPPSAGLEPGGMTIPDESGGMEIIPRGRGTSGRPVPMRIRTESRPQAGQTRAEVTAEASTAGQRAILHVPVFSEPQKPLIPPAQLPEEPSPQQAAGSGHSAIAGQPVGYNYVAAADINSIPYAGSSMTSVNTAAGENSDLAGRPTAIRGTTQAGSSREIQPRSPHLPGAPAAFSEAPVAPMMQQQSATPVASPPFEFPAVAHGMGGGSTAAPRDASDGGAPVSADPLPPRSQVIMEQTPTHFDPGQETESGTPPQSISPPQSSPFYGHSFAAPGTSGFRASVESDAGAWIDPYRNRTGLQPEGSEPTPAPVPSVVMPPGYSAWWNSLVQQRAGIAPRAMSVDVTSLVQQALLHSPQVQVLQADPEVLNHAVSVEEAAFDWRAFLDAEYDELNDPVGNTLTTGNNSNRFENNVVKSSGGLRRRTETGGELKVSEQLGHQYNNSIYLLPNPQATSWLELSFRQPLLSRAGTVYNQNQIVLARINANSSSDEALQEIQAHLYSVAEVYWRLYRARAEFFQRQKLLASAKNVLTRLEGRNQVDTIPRQILRARAAVARAESRMQRAVTDIRNSESQLRLLVNDPLMLNSGPIEFTPTEMPATIPSPTGLRESLQEALINRPDISRAIRQMRASGVRLGVSKSEMLPKLDFIVTTYVAGLQDRAQIADATGNSFSQGRPAYTEGMEFEVPLGNRAARAKMEQRQWELRRAVNSFRATVETSLTEVEISCREVDTSWRELLGKFEAMVAAQNEVSYLQDRFEVLPAVEESSMLLLEDLLDGYERLADEESAFAQAQANYALSIIQLRRATGILMRSRHDAPQLEPDETAYMTSRADQTATGVESRASQTMRTANLTNSGPLRNNGPVPASWTKPVGEPPDDKAQGTIAPVPRRRGGNTPAPESRSLGGHSFGKGN